MSNRNKDVLSLPALLDQNSSISKSLSTSIDDDDKDFQIDSHRAQTSTQLKHSLQRIKIHDQQRDKTIKWRMSQPVEIWSHSTMKWCPAEIFYITQNANGYTLDVRYWEKPRSLETKATYLEPLSKYIRPISTQYPSRDEWKSGSKVECFSHSQNRWYNAIVTDVKRYINDKEDWLSIEWSTNNDGNHQIMSKPVVRSATWIRHRYPSSQIDSVRIMYFVNIKNI